MRIAINGYEAVVPRFGYSEKGLPNRVGSSIYCYELLVHLNRIDKKNNYVIYLPSFIESDPASLGLPRTSENWKYVSVKKRIGPWTITGLGFELLRKKEKPDVFFSPTHYLPFSAPAKSVVSILDVSYLHFPQLFKSKDLYQLKIWGGYSVRKAKKILTISDSSKSDIIKKYALAKEKVEVVYPGITLVSSSNQSFNMNNLKEKYGILENYILFVGTLQPRKNIVRLIEAFSKIVRNYSSSERSESRSQFSTRRVPDGNPSSSNNNGLQLVIIGKKGWQYEEILKAPAKFGIEKRVKFLDSVSNEELPIFYQHAEFFILPSLYEGFGLPILEAMNYGCPVITSNVSSLPEAGGDAALYVDPKNVDDIYEKMKKLLSDDNLKKELIEKGYAQVKKFSWEKSARETLKVLEEVGNSK